MLNLLSLFIALKLLVLFECLGWNQHFQVFSYVFSPLPFASRKRISSNLHATFDQKGALFEDGDSDRLKKAKLRLAEVRGAIPFGSSELLINELTKANTNSSGSNLFASILSQTSKASTSSKLREISWRVAEPEIKYDPAYASAQLMRQPITWITRNVQIFVPIALFTMRVILDLLQGKEEEERRSLRAEELVDIISSQSPALIKAGQALSSRPDLLPKDYLESLQKLQDRCPPFSNDQAFALFKEETGYDFFEIFDLDVPHPIAAASIGQVYKGRLKSNNASVAIKIQRPKCEESVAVDLFVMRWYASQIQSLLYRSLKRNLDLTSVIDDFGELLYREIDYRAEAINAQRFAELYANVPDVFVPKIYTDLSTRKVLTMEWVDGARLNDAKALAAMGLDGTKLVKILIECSLRQILDNGFFHADPHAGNLLAMANGKLCYLDFGMVSYVEASQRYSIITAIVDLVNRDFTALAELYRQMGFIPPDVDAAPIVAALEKALPDVLNAPVGEFNFKKVINKLGDVMYKFPFSLPAFYIAIIRCLGVLEGLAIQVDANFRIINEAYPYIASRLLSDPSQELQAALQQLLFTETGKLRWDRLENLLARASLMTDYDHFQAIEPLLQYLTTPAAAVIRENLRQELLTIFDTFETETVELFLAQTQSKDGTYTIIDWPQTVVNLWNLLQDYLLTATTTSNHRPAISEWRLHQRLNAVMDQFTQTMESREAMKEKTGELSRKSVEAQQSLAAMRSLLRIVSILRHHREESSTTTTTSASASKRDHRNSNNNHRVMARIVRKIIREPVLQDLLSSIFRDISQRLVTKNVLRVLGG